MKKIKGLTTHILFTFLISILLLPVISNGQKKIGIDTTIKINGQSDFDAHFGKWETKLKRLKNPLSGSTTWIEYKGTTIVKSIFTMLKCVLTMLECKITI